MNHTSKIFNENTFDIDDTVISFESEHLGMGIMSFKPEIGEKYAVKIKYRNIYEKEGFVMIVESVADKENICLLV